MKNSEILKAALKKIQKGWIKNEWAQDKNGELALVQSSEAVKFCSVGAIDGVIKNQTFGPLAAAELTNSVCSLLVRVSRIKQLHRYGNHPLAAILKWNDAPWRTKKQVVNLFKKAITLALKEEAKSK